MYNGILLNDKKESNSFIYSHMDGTEGYQVKQNKPDTEKQVPHTLAYTWTLKI